MNTTTTFTSVECYQLLHNRRNKSCNKSRQIGVGLRELEYCGRQTCSKIYSLWFYKLIFDSQGRRGERRKCRQQARPSMSFDDNMIDLLGENLLSGTKFKSVPLSGDTEISLEHGVGQVNGSILAKNQLDSRSRFDTMPTCDGRTNGHMTTAHIPR